MMGVPNVTTSAAPNTTVIPCCGLADDVTGVVVPCSDADTGMMMMATTFVMLMTHATGLAQAGLIRRKNALSMLMQTMSGFVYGSILWFFGGFSLTFGKSIGGLGLLGNLDDAFFRNVGITTCYVHSTARTIPGMLFAAWQMMFAVMVPVIVTGAWAERLTFNAFSVFVCVWPILVYYPLAHWVWNGQGWLAQMGLLDFAGGMTIHASSGVAGLVVAAVLAGRSKNRSADAQAHHNLPLTVLGGALVWGSWFVCRCATAACRLCC